MGLLDKELQILSLERAAKSEEVIKALVKIGITPQNCFFDQEDNLIIPVSEIQKDKLKTLKDLEKRQGIDSFICLNPIDLKQEAIKWIKEFQIERTKAISEMFENPDHLGIYPTTKFFNRIDNFWLQRFNITGDDLNA